MWPVRSPAHGDTRKALLQGMQTMPVHEDDHPRRHPRFAPQSSLRSQPSRRRTRGGAEGAGADARVERLSNPAAAADHGAAQSADRFERPRVAVDTVLFAVRERRLRTYLVQLARGPARGKWAFPGGLVRRLEQLFSFGDPSRDPDAHVVSVAYMALIADSERVSGPPSPKYAAGGWFELFKLPPLAYDHALMAAYALRRLKSKLEYSNIAYTLLPRMFTFAELEEVYARILDRPIDRRNFRRRILAMGLLRPLHETRRGPHRPAALYTFARQTLQMIEML